MPEQEFWAAGQPDATDGDQEVVADLAERREDLKVTINQLSLTMPSIGQTLVWFQVGVILFIATVVAIFGPYFSSKFPKSLATIAAFAVVVLAFMLYAASRRLAAENARRRMYRSLIKRAQYLVDRTNEILEEGAPQKKEVSFHG